MKNAKVHPFLRGVSDEHLAKLRELSLYAEYGAGDVILREGAPADALYLIDEGKVSLETDSAGEGLVQVQTLKDGEALGWSWLYRPFTWHFDARAIKRTTGHWYDGKKLREMCETDHEFGYELMRRVSEVMLARLQHTRREVVKLYRKQTTKKQAAKRVTSSRRARP